MSRTLINVGRTPSEKKSDDPPMNMEQAELFVLSKVPKNGCFYLPCGQKMEPAIVQMAFEKLLMGDYLVLINVDYVPMPGPRGRPMPVLCKFYKASEAGHQRRTILRGIASFVN